MRLINIFETLKRESYEISYKELKEIIKTNSDVVLLDVRSPQEFIEGHLKNAINVPLYELCGSIENKMKCKENIIIAYCLSGKRSKMAVKKLKRMGFKNVYSLKDGIENI